MRSHNNVPPMSRGQDWEDVEYAYAGDVRLIARRFDPHTSSGRGLVMVHGGAWTANDRTTPWVMCRHLANRGFLVLSLDFRCGPEFQHPSAVADICAGIRYLRESSSSCHIDDESIGLIGSSSGGHLALLASLQPDIDEHRTTNFIRPTQQGTKQVSAEVAYVVALWPVSDPVFRYRYAQRVGREELVAAHRGYFRSQVAMRNASVQDVLRTTRNTHMPPAMVVQPGLDANVPEPMTFDLIKAYQEGGGHVRYQYVPGLPHAYAYEESPHTQKLAGEVCSFIESTLD